MFSLSVEGVKLLNLRLEEYQLDQGQKKYSWYSIPYIE